MHMQRQLIASFLLLSVLSCGRSLTAPAPYVEETPTGPATYATSPVNPNPLSLACIALQGVCGSETPCCGEARCIEYTVYDHRRCLMGRADGEFCYRDEQCSSLSCKGGACAAAGCVPEGITCQSNSDCCAGTFCDELNNLYSYIPLQRCQAPKANGSSCTDHSHCQSGICNDYQCVSSLCSAVDVQCSGDVDCCEGLFCDTLTYAPVACKAPRVNGANCTADNHCQSNNCEDYQCVAAVCAPQGDGCEVDGDCCAGSFCSNFTYAAWECQPSVDAGEWCLTNRQCKSQVCSAAHQCQ